MVEGAVNLPFFRPGWTHSHVMNAVSESGVLAVTGGPSSAVNSVRCFQSAAYD